MGWSEAAWPNTKRYVPPVRTSVSQEMKVIPNDFGVHHRWSSSGVVHALKTMEAGPLNVRLTISSRSALRSTVVRFSVVHLTSLAFIELLLRFQLFDNLIQ